MHVRIAAWLPAVLAFVSVCGVAGARPMRTSAPDIAALLDAYDRGGYQDVGRQLKAIQDVRILDRLDQDLRDGARRWIENGDSDRRVRRAFVAGALAAELTHELLRRVSFQTIGRPDNHAKRPTALPELSRYIYGQIGTRRDEREREWTLVCLATWLEWGSANEGGFQDAQYAPGWGYLVGEHKLFEQTPPADSFGRGGFLAAASRHFPDDARLALAVVEAHEAIETRCPSGFCYDEMTPASLRELRDRARTKPPNDGGPQARTLLRSHAFAAMNLAAFDRLVPVAAEFAAVASAHPAVRAEANAHIGYLALRAGRPDAALTPLATATMTPDGYVRYLAEHFNGRALEALGRREDAIAAYRRALTVVPNAPSTATLLASQLFLSDTPADRDEANAVLRASNAASPRPMDPWDLYWHGDAYLWPVYMERLQRALRP